jgi:hypothetical protein
LKKLGYKFFINFENIIIYHIKLFQNIILKNNLYLKNFDFYFSNLIDYNDYFFLIDDLFNNIFWNIRKNLTIPTYNDIKFENNFFPFYNFKKKFDFKFIFK